MDTAVQKPHINVDYFEDLTGDISAPESLSVEEIGVRIKTIREEKGISLQELSKLTGFEMEALSDIEANRFQPQLGTIIKLSKALDSAFGRLVSGVGSKLYSVTRKNERKTISRSTSYRDQKPVYLYKSLAPEVKGRHMESLLVQLAENPDGDMSVHEGEEFIYVLDGVVTLKIGGDAFELEAGDSVYYLSTTPHLIASKTGKATILAVIYEG
ncbi:MAG: helix-turn-helix transcriptional regulator [Deltaproteobacteria bacterium]|nr:helix-turn-helix transcriptional regulator [Deltaproteobacteria bacterium]